MDGGIVLFAAVSLAILKYAPALASPNTELIPLRSPIATAKFEDGAELQILQSGAGVVQDGDMGTSPKNGKFSSWGWQPDRGSGSSTDDWTQISSSYATLDRELAGRILLHIKRLGG